MGIINTGRYVTKTTDDGNKTIHYADGLIMKLKTCAECKRAYLARFSYCVWCAQLPMAVIHGDE